MNLSEIMEDLKDIRYYYAHKDVFESAARENVYNDVVRKVRKYTALVEKAPPILFDLYVSLYMLNNTQAAFAYDRDYTTNYIKELNNKLCLYILDTIKQQGGESQWNGAYRNS